MTIHSPSGIQTPYQGNVDTEYLQNRVRVLERNGLFLAIQSAIGTNLIAQWGYETFWDQFEDETAITTKTNAYYDATNDLYTSLTPGTVNRLINGTVSTDSNYAHTEALVVDGTIDKQKQRLWVGESVFYDLGADQDPVAPDGIRIYCKLGNPPGYLSPVPTMDTFVLYGSNNNTDWTTLLTVVDGTGWVEDLSGQQDGTYIGHADFVIPNSVTPYRYFKLKAGNGTEREFGLYEWQLFAPSTSDITLVSDLQTTIEIPTGGTLMVIVEPIDVLTMGTDIKLYLTRDGGTTWNEVTLTKADGITPMTNYETWIGDVLFSGPTGTSAGYKIVSDNAKAFNIKAVAFQVRP